ncbi:hypothetical protein UB46_28710 [Burkholderiaceae bacterium 16]|nr:hypothetical protein UB46_28710 [Burkholderiaceae bacterium 16]
MQIPRPEAVLDGRLDFAVLPEAHLGPSMAAVKRFLAATARLEEIRASARHVARVRHIGLTELIALTWFPSLVRKLKGVYPQVTLQPDVDLSASLRDKKRPGIA